MIIPRIPLEMRQPGRPVDRSQFYKELRNPEVMCHFAGRLHTEVGSQGRDAQIAWCETTFNRAAARGKSLMTTLCGHYFPRSRDGTYTPIRINNPAYFALIRKVAEEGTNTTYGATGNASGTVGFGRRGFQTAAYRGERFGVEEGDKKWWRTIFPSLFKFGKAIVDTVVGAGKWVIRKIGSLFSSDRPEPHHAQPNRDAPVREWRIRRDEPDHRHVPQKKPPVPGGWKINYKSSTPPAPRPTASVAARNPHVAL